MKKKPKKSRRPKFLIDSWYGCYPSRWGDLLSAGAISHPAKYSSKLIRRIYEHIVDEGWVDVGDGVFDPFGGIGLGALDAMRHGLQWRGIELEPRFVEYAMAEYECPGFSKEFWKRYYLRKDYIAQLRAKHELCPACEAALEPTTKLQKHTKRVIGRSIPETSQHIYRGNIPSWNRRFGSLPNWGNARLLQGDSRNLVEILKNEIQTVVMQSPPFGSSIKGGGIAQKGYLTKSGQMDLIGQRSYMPNTQGESNGQLANLPEGDFEVSLLVGSPPYADSIKNSEKGSGFDYSKADHKTGVKPTVGREATAKGYGSTPGNLGSMPAGDFEATILVSSPPYTNAAVPQDDRDFSGLQAQLEQKHNRTMKRSADMMGGGGYGDTPGQLGKMKTGDFELALGSPPYAETTITENRQFKSAKNPDNNEAKNLRNSGGDSVGITTGQIGQLPAIHFEIAISSPPFRHSEGGTPKPKEGGTIDVKLQARHAAGNSAAAGYGATSGQLANLPEGDFEASLLVGSPPFEKNSEGVMRASKFKNPEKFAREQMNKGNGASYEAKMKAMKTDELRAEYGTTQGNVGNEQGEDFWLAARQIVQQSFEALKPGGHACWVVKDFVKNKARVPFCDQWRQLCEAVGFETIHEHHAELVRDLGTSHTLEGGEIAHKKSSKSFFRRVAEKKGSPTIDFEVVFCMVKPL